MGKIATIKTVDAILKSRGLFAKKAFGQNFLVNSAVAEGIIKTSEISPDALVIEIGPGLGALTEELVKKAKSVVAYEIDGELATIVQELVPASNLTVVNEDFLKVDLERLCEKTPYARLEVFSNLPYYATTAILYKLLTSRAPITKITVATQKEIGLKLAKQAEGKDRPALSYLIRFCADATVVKYVSKNDFYPRPKVDSVVIELKRHETPLTPERFAYYLKILFAERRKTIANNLTSYYKDKNKTEEILKFCGINGSERAENLLQKEVETLVSRMAKEEI